VVKNEWSYTSCPPVCHHGVERANFDTLALFKTFLGNTGRYYEKFKDIRHLG
jgi:hypothetical protein